MKIHNLEAFVPLNSGCMSDLVSPEFTTSVNLKAHKLQKPVPLQLGTVGSHLKINFGLFTDFKIGRTKNTHYFDVVNINWYNAILSTVFIRKPGITLDFKCNEVQVKKEVLNTIIKGQTSSSKLKACHVSSTPKVE